MAARGRKAGFKMTDEHRDKIAKSNILRRLIDFSEGKVGVDMAPHQVTAALGLMRKVLPDLSAVEVDADVTQNVISAKPLTPEEWAEQYASED